MRFAITTGGNGLLAIKDSHNGRLVCAFFRDRGRPEAAQRMAEVCAAALNEAVRAPNKTTRKQDA